VKLKNRIKKNGLCPANPLTGKGRRNVWKASARYRQANIKGLASRGRQKPVFSAKKTRLGDGDVRGESYKVEKGKTAEEKREFERGARAKS